MRRVENVFAAIKRSYQQMIFVVLSFVMMVAVSYVYTSNIVRSLIQANGEEILKSAGTTVESRLEAYELSLAHVSVAVESLVRSGSTQEEVYRLLSDWEHWLKANEAKYNDFTGVYGYVRGEYLDGLNWEIQDDFIPQERPWYKGAVAAKGEPYFSDPYLDANTGNSVITISKAFFTDDHPEPSIVCADMYIGHLFDVVHDLHLKDNGYGFLLDKDMTILTHPEESFIGLDFAQDDPSRIELLKMLEEEEEVSAQRYISQRGESSVIFLRKLTNGWYIGIVSSGQSYYKEIYSMAMVLSLMGAVLMGFLIYILMRLSFDSAKTEGESRSKSSFLARMSHEIRTPMNAIIGMTELILREKIPPVVAEHMAGIKQASANLLSIINDILDFSRIESGKLILVEETYHFMSLLNDVLSVIRMRLTDRPILLAVNADCNIPQELIGDETRVRQVLMNLLGNAVKYTEKGFISICVSCESMNEDIVNLKIDIADSGIGIKEESLAAVFNDFEQTDIVRNRGIEGTGLGLTITKSLVSAMLGEISVESVYGEGSVFTVKLPQQFRQYDPIARVRDAESLNVLIYETRKVYATSICSTLTNLGVPCDEVYDHFGIAGALNMKRYTHLILPNFIYESMREDIEQLGEKKDITIVVLVEYGTVTSARNVRTLALPVHAASIANILNNDSERASYLEQPDNEFMFIAPKARVLVVDDIESNLMVAKGLLAPYQMLIDLSRSGDEAVKLVKKHRYDLIFIDHMMPGMDGVETTAAIRALGEEYYKKVPIVALTANAVIGVREMLINNGMNDFLSKPIDTKALSDVLKKWVPIHKQKEFKGIQGEDEHAPIILEGVDVPLGISMTGGSVKNYLDMLRVFVMECKDKEQQIQKCYEEKNSLHLYTVFVHALKSAAGNIGAIEFSEFAKKLEYAGRHEDLVFIENNTEVFLTELRQMVPRIEKVLAEHEDQGGEEVDPKVLSQKLLLLRNAIENIQIGEATTLLSELRSMGGKAPLREAIDKIDMALLQSEYEQANALIDELKDDEGPPAANFLKKV